MKKRCMFLFLVLIAITLAITCSAESQRDFRAEFDQMELEELEEISSILSEVINEKRIGNAVLQVSCDSDKIAAGKMAKLSVTVTERTITAKTVITYTSSDEAIATIQNGQVKGVATGKATIKASALFEDGATLEAETEISVYVPVKSLNAPAQANVFAGGTLDLKDIVSVLPDDATEKGLFFASDNEEVITVSEDGIVTGVKGGKAVITVTSAEEADKPASKTINISVTEAVSSIKLDVKEFDVGKGRNYTITATVLPESATNKKLVWSTGDSKIASVTNAGVVKGVGTGKTRITCTADDGSGISAYADVTVITSVNSVTIQERTPIVMAGETITLHSTVTPTDATNPKLTWVVDNSSIATPGLNGVITGNRSGKTTVTARTQDGSGKEASVTLYVEPKNPVDVSQIHWQTTWGMKNGKMGVGLTNLCSKLTLKTIECRIECVSWIGSSTTTVEDFKVNLGEYSGVHWAPSPDKLSHRSVLG